MARAFCIPGVLLIFAALVLLVITSINVPFLDGVDFVRTHFNDASHLPQAPDGQSTMSQIRFGLWGYCTEDEAGDRTCHHQRAYSISVKSPTDNNTINISPNWTRGLAIHPVAAAVTFIAFLFGLSQHITLTLIASLLAFLAALLTFIAFMVDIALLAFVKHEMDNNLQDSAKTIAAPGFWLTFVSLIVLLLGGCTVCFGRRRDRNYGETYPTYQKRPFWQRWRRT